MPDLHVFYIWLLFQGTPVVVLKQKCFVVWRRRRRNKKNRKTRKEKAKIYFCLITILPSLVDVRSWIYKTKAVCALQVSPDRCLRSQQQQLKGKQTPCKQKNNERQSVQCFLIARVLNCVVCVMSIEQILFKSCWSLFFFEPPTFTLWSDQDHWFFRPRTALMSDNNFTDRHVRGWSWCLIFF